MQPYNGETYNYDNVILFNNKYAKMQLHKSKF